MSATLVFERQVACREKVFNCTLASGTIAIPTDFRNVHAVNIAQNTTTPVAEQFAWSFVASTGVLTIKSTNSSSTAVVSAHAIAF